MISHREVCVRMYDRWQIRNTQQLPEGAGKRKAGRAHRTNSLFVSESDRTGPSRKLFTVGAQRI